MKRNSIVLAVIATALVGAATYSHLRRAGDPLPIAPGGQAPGTGDPPAADWSPESSAGKPVTAAADAAPSPPLPPLPDVSEAGTLVTAGAKYAVPLTWKKGERSKFKYEIVETSATTDIESGGSILFRDTQRLSVEVLAGDGEGPSKVRVVIDSLRVQFPRPNGLTLDFDSLVGDPVLLRDPGFRRFMEPRLAVLGRPLDFHIDPDGRIVDIDGADDFRERYLDAADRVTPGQARRAQDIPTKATLTTVWETLLFPRLGAGAVEAGAGRRYACRYQIPGGWAVAWNGKFDAYKERDDAIRFEAVATPSPVQDDTAPPSEAAVAKVNAIGDGDAMQVAWWFSKRTGGILEARVRAKYQVHVSYQAGTKPDGTADYAPKFNIVERHILIRRTSEE